MEPVVEGVIAVISAGQRLLMIRRSDHVRVPGAWCFPGGGVRPGESQPQALAREVFEEVALRVEPAEKVWEWTRPDGRLRLHWWTAELQDPTRAECLRLDPDEVAEARWLPPVEIRTLPNLIPNNRDFLDHWERLGR